MMQRDQKSRYQQMRTMLNEKQWRQCLALDAQEQGNILEVARDAGFSKNTIRRGREEIEAGERYTPGALQRREQAEKRKRARMKP